MRKSGWTVAAGLGSLLLLLTACGGSSSSTSTSTTGTASSSSSSGPATSSASSTSSAHAQATSSSSSAKQTAGAQPSSVVTFPPKGTTVLIIQHSKLGWVLAEASEKVVYTYAKDSKGGPPTCTGSCASVWAPVTGVPMAGPADNFPGTFGVVTGAGGVKQITYNGYPLYTLIGAPVFSTKGNGLGGVWHVIFLSKSDITGG
jgi:predicted lipoprotein with Yx(FWY)xxD motif